MIRDAKQFTGLSDCQARSVNKIDYHINTALSAVNVAKAEPGAGQHPFSMATVKTLYHNRLLLDRFFAILPKGTKLTKNDPQVRQLYNFGCMAA